MGLFILLTGDFQWVSLFPPGVRSTKGRMIDSPQNAKIQDLTPGQDVYRQIAYRQIDRPGTPGHPEASPHFGRIFPVDDNPIMHGRAPLPEPLRAFLEGGAHIDDDSLSAERHLKGQRVGVPVPREIIGPEGRNVQKEGCGAVIEPHIAGGRKVGGEHHAVARHLCEG